VSTRRDANANARSFVRRECRARAARTATRSFARAFVRPFVRSFVVMESPTRRVCEMTAEERRAYVRALVRARATTTRTTTRTAREEHEKDASRGDDVGATTSDARTRGRGRKEVKSRYMDHRARQTTGRFDFKVADEPPRTRTRTRTGAAARMAAVPKVANRDRRERLAGRHSRAAIEAEVMARRAAEETFSPRTHGEARRDATRAGRFRAEEMAKKALDALATPKTALWTRAAEVKAAEEAEVFEKSCTFAPKTGRGPKTPATKPASERLYEQAEMRAENRARARTRVLETEMENLTFTPSVNPPTSDRVKKNPPLHRRVEQVLREKENVKSEARIRVEDERAKAYTFRPVINPTSDALARQRQEIEREMGEDETTRRSRRPDPTADADAELTFAPKIARRSERVVEELSRQGKLGVGFLERQRDFSERVTRRVEERRAMVDEECTFTPDIGRADEVLRRGRHVYRLIETPEERAERLAVEDARRKRDEQREREREHYEQFTYEPALNERSRKLAPYATSVDDLARDERRDLARRQAQAQREREFREEHTFEPNLGKSETARRARQESQDGMEYGLDGDAVSARIESHRREKEAALDILRKNAAYRELEECTFQPETTPHDPRAMCAPSSSKVRGMDSFLRKQAAARRLEEEKRARVAAAFLENIDDFDRRHRRTIPEPFSVAENIDEKAESRRKALAEERIRREMEECTFAPDTSRPSRRRR